MDLIKCFRRECVAIGGNYTDKESVFRGISELALKSPVLKGVSPSVILDGLHERESIGSTGFEKGIAIPHCGIDCEEFTVGLIILPQGIDFNSMDGRPSKLIFFIVGPESQRNEHIHLLSGISRVLLTGNTAEQLLAADNPDRIWEIMTGEVAGQVGEKADATGQMCMFQVYVQLEDRFDEILEVFSELDNCSVTILEASSANRYLHFIPLFAAFWNDDESTFSRIIMAVVDKAMANELLRRIDSLMGGLGEQTPGVMVTVQEIQVCRGKLDF
ncbi:MAG: hypothetical protein CVV64_13445 [Candidatus Wallbacteria bacterium HGW-Wallbacteria-1]|jgi:PTS system nitrogen regulatory IIA component|uniref:PTS EIIA type-2 domain-containing protein n=1 Tax=Candidatus Wallbacteria bacterium HGW-Wallbacteria-1 TaxID=2013854 RepID=A0A2N1PMK7_9BACT|nr:MAG: hypothetical protein CVV64_13445 [Candidatus Wallbacteria bacterium HGW-Wallbacteria-1]